ncbi:hypothetical protein GJAV_G00118940 [Gymnothorax javanicus]|nr:hypothetical protein GJAV_G00118940 [Gymnothorax javanicus]
MLVFWPKVTNATKHLKERRTPSDGWSTFPLIKVKMRSEAEKDEVMAKRRRKSKQLEDFLAGDFENTVSDSEPELEDGQSSSSNEELELPAPPRKLGRVQQRESQVCSRSSSTSSRRSTSPVLQVTPVSKENELSRARSASSTPQSTRPKKASLDIQLTAEDQSGQSLLHPIQKKHSPYPMPEAIIDSDIKFTS